jgi:hypothetical protein
VKSISLREGIEETAIEKNWLSGQTISQLHYVIRGIDNLAMLHQIFTIERSINKYGSHYIRIRSKGLKQTTILLSETIRIERIKIRAE